MGELDIMDTWATSSLSPQLACGWLDDEDLFARTYPMDLRPQGQDIIRTWLFSTVVRADLESVKGDLEAASKAVGALTVAASDDAEATESSIESFELGEVPAKRKG